MTGITAVFEKRFFKNKLDEIGMHLHSMSVYVSNDNKESFLKTYDLIKECFRKHFHEEEKEFLSESNKLNYYHKIVHKIFNMDLIRYEKSLHDSNNARMQILVKIQNWYLNHLKDFDSKLNQN
ncbi:MAG: hypothetical protein COA79_07720 [Planctomycetota bacterium]|nr:MAG: hypothetical protein COA79_07720 [Planctomycetota bacterium]